MATSKMSIADARSIICEPFVKNADRDLRECKRPREGYTLLVDGEKTDVSFLSDVKPGLVCWWDDTSYSPAHYLEPTDLVEVTYGNE